jgi:hypothetical protein
LCHNFRFGIQANAFGEVDGQVVELFMGVLINGGLDFKD